MARSYLVRGLWLSAACLALASGGALAQSAFVAPAANFEGAVRASALEQGAPIFAGSEINLAGSGFAPGQEITLQRGAETLNVDGPIVADEEGAFSFGFTIPADASTGQHPIILRADNPSAASVFEVKVSPDVPLSGEDKFAVASAPLVPGLYQSAYSAANDRIFVTAAVGRPPVSRSSLLKVNPETLEVEAEVTPQAAPARPDGSDGGVFAVYGVGVDDVNNTVWVTNTRQNTVAVYNQDDLSLLKQFDPGAVPHSRDVIAAPDGRVFASPVGEPVVKVFDGATLEELEPIEIASNVRGEEFSVMSLELDPAGERLFTVSISTNEFAVIDIESGDVTVLPLSGARSASGVAYDGESDRLFVASQGTDNLLILDATSGDVLHDVAVGAGALNVAFDPAHRLAYVASRAAGTVTVVDVDGNIVGNLGGGTYPNHAHEDGKGNVFAINKSRGEDDPEGDRITRITPVE